MEDRQPTTKSILENYSGNILDIPNRRESILDSSVYKKVKRKCLLMKDHK